MNLNHLPGAKVGDPRCTCISCERKRADENRAAYTLNIVAPAELVPEGHGGEAITLQSGAVCRYLSHLPGGIVKVEFEGAEYVMHPGATKELR